MFKDFLLALTSLIITNMLGLALPVLLAAWLFTLILPVSFNQMVWLVLGMFFLIRYSIQTIVDLPGENTNLTAIFLSVVASFVFLVLSGLFGWGLLQIVTVDLSLFEAILLFAISIGGGFYLIIRSGAGGLPVWMTMPDVETEDFDEDYVMPPPKTRRQRRRRAR